jgi:hypothetical protein
VIDHKRLTSAESRVFRLMLSGLFAMAGFVVTTGLIVGMFPAPVKGVPSPVLVSQTETVDTPVTADVPVPGAEVPVETPATTPEVTTPATPDHTPTATPEPLPAPTEVTRVPTTETPAPIAEDDPGWRCDTMGNRVCGVPDGYGQFVLVCHDVTGYPIRVVYDPNSCA